ncbi:helix-turn-helix domain-containing protein [Roseobacter sp.]|uniref:helix-turn-helix domain-containing protein n=1 Tax=Roseobacter sp. TaxID=1907202 RepID=UPI003298D481
MSGMALIWAANVKGLKPAAKIVLIQLADFHNKETDQCNPSAKRLADECEMGRATLFRHMTTLEECGLVTRHARGDGDGGRGFNQYELHLDITLGPSARPKGGSSGANGVSSQNETGGNVSKMRGKSLKGETGVVSNRDRNLTIEPKKEPPSRRREAAAVDEDVICILAAYPQDRRRDEGTCHQLISDALQYVSVQDLLSAVQAHAARTTGFTRSKVSFSDNWFRREEWRRRVEEEREHSKSDNRAMAQLVANAAEWIKGKSPLCKHVSHEHAIAAIDAGLLTKQQVVAAGIQL